jgi:hypothetical protein
VNCSDHYCLPPLQRFNLEEILTLIQQKKYFVLHAPRQTGKTSCLLALMEYLNHAGTYRSLYVNIENAQAAPEDVAFGMQSVLRSLASSSRDYIGETFLLERVEEVLTKSGPFNALEELLSLWAVHETHPIVLLIDEVDSLVGDTLISVLRQIRSGYSKRPSHFPSSIVLCGVHDVRDYRIHSEHEKSAITGGSVFNIKAESLRLGNFSCEEVVQLCGQHTGETGQVFHKEALTLIWTLTCGQPWLVNALTYEVCFKMPGGVDRTMPITVDLIEDAKERLIMRRETHLDQLADKLKEERVRRVIEPILMNEEFELNFLMEDVEYVEDLGLVTRSRNGEMIIANPVYREFIPRELSLGVHKGTLVMSSWLSTEDESLDFFALLTAFQKFYRERSEKWAETAQYRKAAPQILLQAFLQRVVNSGGRVEREYELGRGRTDLLVIWSLLDGSVQRAVIECKVLKGSREKTIEEGLTQVYQYADRCGVKDAHLVIFDLTPAKTWDEKIFSDIAFYGGTPEQPGRLSVIVWGM